jgi:phage terminase small subunit
VTPKKNIVRKPTYTLPDGSLIPSMGEEFTAKESRFIFWYTYPGSEAFLNAGRAATRAGYKGSSAVWQGYQLRHKSDVDAAIKNILTSMVSVDIEELYQQALEMLRHRAFFNLADYVKQRTLTIKVGKDDYRDIEVECFKDLSELTPEQLKAVDGIDYRGVNGTRVLVMADRRETLRDIINIRNKINGLTDNNNFDVEATAEIIKGQLSLKVSARKNKEELSQAADYKKEPKDKAAEEL